MRNVIPIFCLLLSAVIAIGQTQTTGGISGTVLDQDGAAIDKASVTITSLANPFRKQQPENYADRCQSDVLVKQKAPSFNGAFGCCWLIKSYR